ncbi:MAG TPA: arylsulfatase [Halieaceae bacterium]|jgi:arylsulfatase|uniref:arylsulfatase n=1 Tax=Haliea TaxID=475794 RepID=UPI000C66BCD6|nr:arylsulfatase [Haliea sp.]HAN69878.1 arylsulfatase [Halieaceae bacterium]MAD64142.1 arylsulfatase [Haliea sp.]MAY92548.1 arylsulfatase [Haliea sp.]MBK40824.1 arylsulfatase [Haliea sp.]HBM84260.1 arylsulfatase [Halieaceae bacterium]|tara:strand:- start:28781 stop:30340 length:1560 start_codon:yes stop_codon:yes gene_type:complete
MHRLIQRAGLCLAFLVAVFTGSALAADKPNILVIWGDDVGQSNISAYTRGLMGYKTPNIDRIANEGMLFTDYYGEQSCTAGRASFIMGQSVFRTGLSKVGLPGAELGMQEEDPTIAGLLKNHGYMTGQFGKNHLGDKDEHLPTNHGFDEFFGNLYHLNAEEEPENEDYPKDPAFREKYGPRGVIRSYADGRIEDTGPLSKRRMETVDDETVAAAKDFITRAVKADTPFFVWWSGTRMHFRTHVSDEKMAMVKKQYPHADEYTAGMIEHDMHIGEFLTLLDELGVADNTLVFYSTDNGPHMNTWPDAAMTPFRGEKNTNWEGGWRVPAAVRWPGKIPAGSVSNDIMHHMDWLPTFLAVAGEPDVKEKLLKGHRAINRKYKVHLDGYNFLPFLTGEAETGPRREIFYFSDDGDLTALRYDAWKLVFLEQRIAQTLQAWQEPFVELRLPYIFNLRRDPYERAQITSNTYYDWMIDRAYLLVPAQDYVAQFLATFKEYPPRQKAASFSLDQVMEKLTTPAGTP